MNGWNFISYIFIIVFACVSKDSNALSSISAHWQYPNQYPTEYKMFPTQDTEGYTGTSWRIIPGFVNNRPPKLYSYPNNQMVNPYQIQQQMFKNNRRKLATPGTTTPASIFVKEHEAPAEDLEEMSRRIERHPGWDVLNSFECGDSAADRIIGGKNAALGQFPWIARLGFLNYDDLDYKCGGALITDRHILTAAHCVKSDFQLTTVRLGEHDDRTNPDCVLTVCAPPVQDRNVKSIISHDRFNNPALHNDIAIIELEQPIDLDDYVAPICLPHGEVIGDVKVGDMVTAAGWGTMNMTTEDRADVLQVVSIPVVNSEQCDLFGKKFKLTSSELCAGAQVNKDACAGDSGGPLSKIYDTPEGPKNYLVGVVSFGPTICGIKKPGVYTSVAHFLPWILDRLIE